MIDGHEAGERFSLVEHPMSPRALAAPLHRHNREDEYSYVLEGRMGALLGDDVVEAGPGDLVHKPRGQWHTFWNAGDEPCRILEIISPAGFERFFAELVDLGGVGATRAPRRSASCAARYALEMQPDSVPELISRFGLVFPGEPHLRTRRHGALNDPGVAWQGRRERSVHQHTSDRGHRQAAPDRSAVAARKWRLCRRPRRTPRRARRRSPAGDGG